MKLYRTVRAFITSAADHRIGAYAAQTSFFILMSLIPFFMFLLSMLNVVIPYLMPSSQLEFLTQIYTLFPEPIAGIVESIILELLEKSTGISVATALTALWFASRSMLSLTQGINNILSDGEIPGYFRTRIMSVVYMLLFTLLIALTLVLLGFGNIIGAVIPSAPETLFKILHLRWVIVFLILTVFFTLFYRFMPQKHRPLRQLIPGAALASVGWLIFTLGFSVYVSFSKAYTSIYGSISYIILAMLWLYFCISILFYGAEVDYMFFMKD